MCEWVEQVFQLQKKKNEGQKEVNNTMWSFH